MMSNLQNIFGQPQHVDGLGDVYPVKVSDYETFAFQANFLKFTKKHFVEEMAEKFTLFELIVGLTLQDKTVQKQFLDLLKTVTHKDFSFVNKNDSEFSFVSDKSILSNKNFDEFREIVMRQNLIYEDRVFKSETVKKWADKVLAARARNSVDMTMEDMVSVVKILGNDSYKEISNYTIYQLEHTFQRILKIDDYRRDIQIAVNGGEVKPSPYVEKINLYKNPYDDVFVDKGKLSSLDQAMN